MTLRLISGENPPELDLPLLQNAPPAALTDLLRSGEALVWWDRKTTINWLPIVLTEVASLMIFVVASLVVPELWSASLQTLLKPLAVLSLPAAVLILREYQSRTVLALTDQAILSVDAQGHAHRLALGDIVATSKDMITGGIKMRGRMDSVVIPTALLEVARRVISNQLRVRTSAIRFNEIDDQAAFFPRKSLN